MRKPADIPQKNCLTCGKPFIWRKKWELTWDKIHYCSEKCRKNKPTPVA